VEAREETPKERVERLIEQAKMSREAVTTAERFWRTRLRDGVLLPNGERAVITLDDLYHVMVDQRVGRKPQRIEQMLRSIFEIRSTDRGRRVAFSRWAEDGKSLVGVIILEANGRLRTLHVVEERRLRRAMQKGDLLWRS
jgi:hypothetical protein